MHLDRRRPGTLSLRAKPKESCCWYWTWVDTDAWTFDLQECRSWFWHYTICFTRVFGISWFCCSFSHLFKASPLWNELQANPNGLQVVLIIDVLCVKIHFPLMNGRKDSCINFNLPCRTTNLLLGCRNSSFTWRFSHLLEASPMIRAAGKPKWAAEVLIIDVLWDLRVLRVWLLFMLQSRYLHWKDPWVYFLYISWAQMCHESAQISASKVSRVLFTFF